MTSDHGTEGRHPLHRIAEARLPTRFAEFRMLAFVAPDGIEHLALMLGTASDAEPFLIRLHSECLTGDALFSLRCDCGFQLQAALERIAQEGAGAVLYLRQEGRGIGLGNKIRAYALQDQGCDTVAANEQLGFPADGRSYEVAVDILRDLGLTRDRLMPNNPRKANALRESGIEVTEIVPVCVGMNIHNVGYLQTKATKLGHRLPTP